MYSNESERAKIVMMISNRKKHFGLQGFHKKINALKVKPLVHCGKGLRPLADEEDYEMAVQSSPWH